MQFLLSLVFLSSCGLLLPAMASAQSLTLFPCSGGINNSITMGATGGGSSNNRECSFADLVELAQAVADQLVKLGLIATPLIFAYAGGILLFQGDQPGKRDKARKIFLNVFIGLGIMMGAWLVVKLVLTALVSPAILNGNNGTTFPFNTN